MFKLTGFYLRTGLPGDINCLQGVKRGNCQDRLPHTLPDRDCVTIPTVNPRVRSVPTQVEGDPNYIIQKNKNTPRLLSITVICINNGNCPLLPIIHDGIIVK